MRQKRFKLGAYGICKKDGQLLLARYVDPRSGNKWWTLPGGKLEHGEDPVSAVRREVREETGYDVEVTRLLGVDSRITDVDWGIPGGAELHSIGVFYAVTIVGGQLTNEENGSTDQARWIPESAVREQDRAVLIDLGLDLYDRLPDDGLPQPVEVMGRLRN